MRFPHQRNQYPPWDPMNKYSKTASSMQFYLIIVFQSSLASYTRLLKIRLFAPAGTPCNMLTFYSPSARIDPAVPAVRMIELAKRLYDQAGHVPVEVSVFFN